MLNFHSGRVRNPGDFIKDSYVTIVLKGVEGIELVSGKLKNDGKGGPLTAQVYRFSKEKFTEKQAKEWLKKHKIKTILFEPAKKEVEEAMKHMPNFETIWNKIAGGKGGQIAEQKVVATTEGDSEYGYAFKGSFEEATDRVRKALKETKKYGDWQNILATFKDRVYFSTYDSMTQKTRFFEVAYELDKGEITLGDATEVIKKTEWIIKEQAGAIAAELFPVTEEEITEAEWTTKIINDLPDSCFAFIKDGGEKDADDKTKPRGMRYLPYKDAEGKIDMPHLRNALARLSQTDLSDDEKKKALKVLEKAAKKAGIGKEKK